jgi:putative DNA primase/helicase
MEPPQTSIPHSSQNGQGPSSHTQTLNFLRWLYGDDAPGWLTIWTLPDKTTAWFPIERLDEASRYATDRAPTHDVYFGVGLRQRKLDKGRGTADDVLAIPGLWIDIDIKHPAHHKLTLPETIEDVLDLLRKAIPLPATILVDSGYGVHAYWLFRELWRLDDDAERARAAHLLRRFQSTILAEGQRQGWRLDSTFNLAQLLRLPGCYNHKVPGEAREVHIHDL